VVVKPLIDHKVYLKLSRPVPVPPPADGSLAGVLRRAYSFSLPVVGGGLVYAVYGAPLVLWLLLARLIQRPEQEDPDRSGARPWWPYSPPSW
jgi:hypothetical protein